MTCRELYLQRQNRAGRLTRDEAQRLPAYWLSGVRHKGGVISDLALVWNVRTCCFDGKRRARAESLREGASIDAKRRDGVVRSSDEACESTLSEGTALFSCAHRSTACGMSR